VRYKLYHAFPFYFERKISWQQKKATAGERPVLAKKATRNPAEDVDKVEAAAIEENSKSFLRGTK